MEYTLDQILDVPLLQALQDKLNAINPFPSALVDNSGKILTATAWQDICTKFHRIHPESEKECIISDQYILSHLHEANPAVTYKCPHGMVDNAVPIVIEGHHMANFFTGQFFLEPPDPDFFRKQAAHYGFDEEAYMEAVKKVPVWNMEKLHLYLDFIKTFTESLALMGLTRLREIKASRLAGENELRFRTIIENTQAGYFFIDKDVIIRDCNDSWVRLYKYNSKEEIVGHHFTEIQRVDDVGKAIAFVNRILAGDPAYLSGEFSRKCKDDSIGYHTFSAGPVVKGGEVVGIEGFIIDNTRQKLAEIDRDITRTRLTSVFDKMVEGFALHEIICDDNGIPVDYRFLDINPAFEKLTGRAAHEIIGRTAREVFPGLEPHWIERYGRVALSGEAGTFENFSAELKKHYRIVAFSNEKGQFATIFDDITERKKYQGELVAAKERAEESDRLKSAFLANISHEIRSPMNSILGFTELLEDMVDDPKQLEYLKIISTGGERLLNIINSVIDIAKIEAGQVNLSPVEFDINPLIQELFELNMKRNIRIEIINDMVSAQPLFLFTDKTKLFQILNNLLSNALKFTRQGTVHFGYSKSSDSITFYVKDTGFGIPTEFKSQVFERFRKVDLHDRTDIEGTGLGLAITKELVKLLQGEIWFDSEPGQGTSFYVRLPV